MHPSRRVIALDYTYQGQNKFKHRNICSALFMVSTIMVILETGLSFSFTLWSIKTKSDARRQKICVWHICHSVKSVVSCIYKNTIVAALIYLHIILASSIRKLFVGKTFSLPFLPATICFVSFIHQHGHAAPFTLTQWLKYHWILTFRFRAAGSRYPNASNVHLSYLPYTATIPRVFCAAHK